MPTRDQTTKRLAYSYYSALVLVLIPGGRFWMGAQKEDPAKPNYDPEAGSDEAPVREVTLSAFFLAKHECTQAQWRAMTGGEAPSRFQEGTEAPRRAVEQVSWQDCQKRLPEIGLVLPTEAQWEYACRAGSTTRFSFRGDQEALAAYAWYGGNGWRTAARLDNLGEVSPVGLLRPNMWGLHDMYGNVWEWCEDKHGADASTTNGPIPDPTAAEVSGPGDRIFRGGSQFDTARFVRSAIRVRGVPGFRYSYLGFRPARAITAN